MQRPMNIAVARAMMLPGRMKARTTLTTIMTTVAIWIGRIAALPESVRRARSNPSDVPMTWKRALSVDIAAARSASMKMTTKRSGIDALMKFGMIVSTLPLGAAARAIKPSVW